MTSHIHNMNNVMSSISMRGRIKKATGVITKISLGDNLVLIMIQLLFILINLIHQTITWLT